MNIDSLRDMSGMMIGFLFLLRGIPAIKDEGDTGSGDSFRGLIEYDIKPSEGEASIFSIGVL